jgi:hypothetical protein
LNRLSSSLDQIARWEEQFILEEQQWLAQAALYGH